MDLFLLVIYHAWYLADDIILVAILLHHLKILVLFLAKKVCCLNHEKFLVAVHLKCQHYWRDGGCTTNFRHSLISLEIMALSARVWHMYRSLSNNMLYLAMLPDQAE
jgi:hypothetical protein